MIAAAASVPCRWPGSWRAPQGSSRSRCSPISVTLGLALSTKLLGGARGKMLLGWHQTLMWTGLAMLVLHGAALALDPVMRFGFVGVLVPGPARGGPCPSPPGS